MTRPGKDQGKEIVFNIAVQVNIVLVPQETISEKIYNFRLLGRANLTIKNLFFLIRRSFLHIIRETINTIAKF